MGQGDISSQIVVENLGEDELKYGDCTEEAKRKS